MATLPPIILGDFELDDMDAPDPPEPPMEPPPELPEPPTGWTPWKDVRGTDPDTSREAAYTVAHLTEVQQHVLVLFREYRAMTDEQLLARYLQQYGPIPESTPRKRRCDLTRLQLICDSGRRATLSTGRKGIIWTLVAHERRNG